VCVLIYIYIYQIHIYISATPPTAEEPVSMYLEVQHLYIYTYMCVNVYR